MRCKKHIINLRKKRKVKLNMEKPIRVLHVLAAMDRAGTESLIMNLYRNIDREKVQFDFAVSAEKNVLSMMKLRF